MTVVNQSSVRSRETFLIAFIALAHLGAPPLYFYLGKETGATQFTTLAIITAALGLLIGINAIVSWRGRPTLGIILTLGTMAIAYPLHLPILVRGMGQVMGPGLVLLGMVTAFQFLPPRSRRTIITLTTGSGVVTFLWDLFGSTARPSLPGLMNQFFAVAVIGVLGFLMARQFRSYSLRTKLVIFFTVVVVVSVGLIVFLNSRATRAALIAAADDRLLGAASQTASRVDDLITSNLNIIQTEAGATRELVEFLKLRASRQPTDSELARIITILDSFAQRDVENITSYALLNRQGFDVADTFTKDIGAYETDRDYFLKPLQTGQPYVSPVTFSPTRQGDAVLYFASPVRDASGRIVGVLRFSYSVNALQELIVQAQGLAGKESFPVMLDENYIRLAHGTTPDLIFKSLVPLDPALLAELQAAGRIPAGTAEENSTNLPDVETALKNMDTEPIFTSTSAALGGSLAETAVVRLKTQPWILYFRQPYNVFLAPVETQTRATLLLAVIITLLAAAVAASVSQVFVIPITNLAATAQRITAGDLTVQAHIEAEDEIGALARAFNAMTAQLRDSIVTLEQRVADRTQALMTATEVSNRISSRIQIEREQLIKEVVELVNSSFHFYHTQIYFIQPGTDDLVLEAATGEAGKAMLQKGHRIPQGKGLVGRAAETNIPVLVSDVSADRNWLPNPLLPETKSELAVPISSGNTVIGVLDVQHNAVQGLTKEHEGVIQTVANQIMIAAQNSRLLMDVQKRAEREAVIVSINRKIQDTTTVESALQVAVREVGRALGAQASVQLAQTSQRTDTK